MSSFVKMALATSIQRLYEKREEDKLADFIIESKDGVQTKVHSLILLSRYLYLQNYTDKLIEFLSEDPCS